jgi:hypothetical protein
VAAVHGWDQREVVVFPLAERLEPKTAFSKTGNAFPARNAAGTKARKSSQNLQAAGRRKERPAIAAAAVQIAQGRVCGRVGRKPTPGNYAILITGRPTLTANSDFYLWRRQAARTGKNMQIRPRGGNSMWTRRELYAVSAKIIIGSVHKPCQASVLAMLVTGGPRVLGGGMLSVSTPLALAASIAHRGRRVIWDARHWRQVTHIAVDHAKQGVDRLLIGDRIEVASVKL